MIRINKNKFATTNRKNKSVEDPHELLLSLVDTGSLDSDEALLACVQEMSDADCKRALCSLGLSDCCDEVEDESAEDDDFVLEDEDAEECDNRAFELEARIRSLKKSLLSESQKRKFEGLHSDMLHELQLVFDDNFAAPSYYGSEREFQLEMEGMADGSNDMMVDDAIQLLCDRFGYDAYRLESVRDDIADSLSQMAQVLLDNMDEDMLESKKHKLESRIKRLEKLLNK